MNCIQYVFFYCYTKFSCSQKKEIDNFNLYMYFDKMLVDK